MLQHAFLLLLSVSHEQYSCCCVQSWIVLQHTHLLLLARLRACGSPAANAFLTSSSSASASCCTPIKPALYRALQDSIAGDMQHTNVAICEAMGKVLHAAMYEAMCEAMYKATCQARNGATCEAICDRECADT